MKGKWLAILACASVCFSSILQVEARHYTLRRVVDRSVAAATGQRGQAAREAFVLEQLLIAEGGNAYVGAMRGARSARAGLQWVVRQIAGGFAADVVGDGALSDAEDRRGQLLFHTVHTQTPIRGLVLAQRVAEGVQVALVYQNVGKPAEGLEEALTAALGRFPRHPAEALHATRFPDGSGSLMLPEGWQIVDAYEGAVNVRGPRGAFVDLGASRIVVDPHTLPEGTPGALVGPYCHPAESLAILLPALDAMNAQLGDATRLQFVRVIEYFDTASPSPAVGGQWALVFYEWALNGEPYLSLGLIGTQRWPVNWGHYWSAVSAPKAGFERELPTLMRIWQSYYVSDQSVARRLDGAVRNMRTAGESYRRGLETASRGADAAAETWKQVLRDQTVVEGPDGWRYDTKLSTLDAFLLEHRDFRRVPVEEIVGGR